MKITDDNIYAEAVKRNPFHEMEGRRVSFIEGVEWDINQMAPIEVSEVLPEKTVGDILAFYIGTLAPNKWYITTGAMLNFQKEDFSHWMSLPELPKQKI